MKTTPTILILTALLAFSSVCTADETNSVSWFRRTFCNLSWEEIQTVVKTPREICAVVRHSVRFVKDRNDEWATGRETWEREAGDCEDYANCIADLCKAAGIEAVVRVFYPPDSAEGHAVVLGLWKGNLWIASNGWYKPVSSMDEAKLYVARQLRWEKKGIMVATMQNFRDGVIAGSSNQR